METLKPRTKKEWSCSPPPWYLLRKVSNLRQKKMNDVLRSFDLTHVQFIILAYAYHHHKSQSNSYLTQTHIAHEGQLEVMMTSKVIRTLEKKWFIHRNKNDKDLRAYHISITKEGIKIFEEAWPEVYKQDQLFFQWIGDHQGIIQTLEKIINQ